MAQIYRFGDFTLDVAAHELRLRGERIRLERRPFDLLVLLVTRAGLLVTREEIIRHLWPARVIIDFDTGLNTLVRKVRLALGDPSEAPVYIETVPGLGYRFVAPVSRAGSTSRNTQADSPVPGPGPATGPAPAAERPRTRRAAQLAVAVIVALVLLTSGVAAWQASHRSAEAIRIAVLPFENLTGDPGYDYLAAGLAEDTNASLAQLNLEHLRTVGRASTLAAATSGQTVVQMGHQLGVDFVVASSLRAEQSRIRVNSHLIRVTDGVELWTASFDRELTSILGLQRELSIAIAEQVRLRLSAGVRDAVARRQTSSPEAYDLYLRGRYQWSLLSPAGNRNALEYFRLAIAQDPGYALAWAGIAHVLSTALITAELEALTVVMPAEHAMSRALENGAELAEVQLALGYYHYLLDWNWPVAEAAFRKAVHRDPNNAIAHLMLGHVLSQSGQHAEARMLARRARELDPFFSHTFALSATMAFQQRDFAAAVEYARQAVAINPEGWIGHLNLGQAQAELGQYADALASFDAAARYSGDNFKSVGYRAHVLASMGRVGEARAVLGMLETRSREQYVPPYVIALIHAGLGEEDTAMAWLERAYEAHDVHLVFLPVDPRWDALRSDPRIQSLLLRCNFFGQDGAGSG